MNTIIRLWKTALVLATIIAVPIALWSPNRLFTASTQANTGPIAIVTSDRDGDGLPDSIEMLLGTNREQPDSDRDGIRDGREIALGLDPLVYNAEYDPEETDRTPGARGDDDRGRANTGVAIRVLSSGPRTISLVIVATSQNRFADLQNVTLGLVRNPRIAGAMPSEPEIAEDGIDIDDIKLSDLIVDRTRAILRASHRTVSDDGKVIALTIDGIDHSDIPRRLGVLATFQDGATVVTRIEYFGVRAQFYEIAFSPNNNGTLTGSHVYHHSFSLNGDPMLLEENEDCRQYLSPISSNPRVYIVTREQCQNRDGFYCPTDCGADVGRIIVRM